MPRKRYESARSSRPITAGIEQAADQLIDLGERPGAARRLAVGGVV